MEPSTIKKPHARACKGGAKDDEKTGKKRYNDVQPYPLYTLRHACLTRWAPHLEPWTLANLAGHQDMAITQTLHPPTNSNHHGCNGPGQSIASCARCAPARFRVPSFLVFIKRPATARSYNPGRMPLQTLHTLSQNKAFQFKYADGEEIIVYPSDDDGHPQEKYAMVITRFEQRLVRDAIRDGGTITIGASRDKPPLGSLGALLKTHGRVPQALSYLAAILVEEKYCAPARNGSALALAFNRAGK